MSAATERETTPAANRRRLVVIGAGSSGLISLQTACEQLPNWDICCYERTDRTTGVWGDPYAGFVSTSTKYTTQFSRFARFDGRPTGRHDFGEFFCNDEYGRYLDAFADAFHLRPHIHLRQAVTSLAPADGGGWTLDLRDETTGDERREHADAVIVATGLAAESRAVASLPADDPRLRSGRELLKATELPRGRRLVVLGGGEFATDIAHRLADPALGNSVWLSLRSGIRVSPRYHPIRGVPSDFLRNRLMLSFHPALRNAIGEAFVRARIRFESTFARLFPGQQRRRATEPSDEAARRRYWGQRLRRAARGGLFDRFHNKADDFLDDVAAGRLHIVGPPADDRLTTFHPFGQNGQNGENGQNGGAPPAIDPKLIEPKLIDPDLIVPALGYRSRLADLTGDAITLADFHLGCVYAADPTLAAVGFARPILGNIPSISEMQARYVCSVLAGATAVPPNLPLHHAHERATHRQRFGELAGEAVYPVEMIPYCDRLATELGAMPRPMGSPLRRLRRWWDIQTTPATTLDYNCFTTPGQAATTNQASAANDDRPPAPRQMPLILIAAIAALRPLDWLVRWRSRD